MNRYWCRFVSVAVLLVLPLALAACRPVQQPVVETERIDEPLQGVNFDEPVSGREGSGGGEIAMFGITPSRNLVNLTGKGVVTDWQVKTRKHPEKNIKWSARLGKVAYGGPLVAGGCVLVGTNNENPRNPAIEEDKGIVMCFRESDGTFLWQAVHVKLPVPLENDWKEQGIASTPAVDGNRVYYVSNRCELVCADLRGNPDKKEAKFIWKLDMMKDLKVYPHFLANCSPLIVGDLVYVVTANGVEAVDFTLPSPKAPSFIAVDKKKGTVVWQSNLPGSNVMDGQWTNPAYAEVGGKGQVIFPGGDGWLYSFEPKTGELFWKFNCNPSTAKFKAGGEGERCYFLATPTIYDNKVYIGVGQNPDYGAGVGHFWCIDLTKKPANKEKDLSPVGDDFDPQSPKNKDSALVWHLGGKIQPKPKTGRTVYFGRTMSTCSIHEGLVYLAELEGLLHCLDAKTGKQYWEYDFLAEVWSSTYWVDGKVIVGTTSGDLYYFDHGKELKEPIKVEVGAPLRTPPVFSNGTLFVMTDSMLYAVGKK